MIPNELCHYTKKDTALEKILSDRQIKISPIGLTNDPKESRPSTPAVMASTINGKEHLEAMPKIHEEMVRAFREEWKVLCMTKHLPQKSYKEVIKNHVKHQFSYGYNRPRMWAQYAENHSGVCIIFDGKKLHNNILAKLGEYSKIFCDSVKYRNYGAAAKNVIKYSDIATLGLTEGLRQHLLGNYRKYFLTKFPDWENESEYRWLVHSATSLSAEYISIEGTIKEIIVGSNFPKIYETSLKEISKELNVSAGRIHWTDGIPNVIFGEIYQA